MKMINDVFAVLQSSDFRKMAGPDHLFYNKRSGWLFEYGMNDL